MNTINLEDIVKSESGVDVVAGSTAKREHLSVWARPQLMTLVNVFTHPKVDTRAETEEPAAVRQSQLERAKVEDRRQRDMVQPPPKVNGVTLRRKLDLECKLFIVTPIAKCS